MIKDINIQMVNCVSLFYFLFPLLVFQLATVVIHFLRATHLNVFISIGF